MKERFSTLFGQRLESLNEYYLSYVASLMIAIILITQQHTPYNLEHYNLSWSICAGAGFVAILGLWVPLYKKFAQNTLALRVQLLTQGATTLIGVGMGTFFYHIISSSYQQQSQVIIFFLASLLAIISIPVLIAVLQRNNQQIQDHWSHLFSLTVLSILSALILWGGISACLGSIEYLFNIVIQSERYSDIGAISFFIVGCSIFLTQLHHKTSTSGNSKRETFFGIYIFLPLAVLYALILTSYALKILTIGIWPEGLVSYMVIGYTLWGYIAYFLTLGIVQDKPRIKFFHRGYLISILMFSILLFGAISIRINQYGFTEMRYLVVLIGLWIVGTGSMGLIRPQRSLLTSISLLASFLLISIYGPLSATHIARHSQFTRLETQLEELGRYKDGVLDTSTKQLETAITTHTQEKQLDTLIATSRYLLDYHGSNALKTLITQATHEDIHTTYDFTHKVLGFTGDIEEYNIYNYGNKVSATEWFSFGHYDYTIIEGFNIHNYRSFYQINNFTPNTDTTHTSPDGETITITLDDTTITIDTDTLASKLYELSNKKKNSNTPLSREELMLPYDGYTIIITDGNGHKTASNYELGDYSFLLFVQ